MEALTSHLEEEATRYISKIDDIGGAIAALERGYQVREIHEAAYRHQREVESGERVIVGVNRYVGDTPPLSGLLRVDPELTRRQIEGLQRLRRERDTLAVKRALQRLEEVARCDENSVPAILECVEAYCTLGEICDVFRSVFGEQGEFTAF